LDEVDPELLKASLKLSILGQGGTKRLTGVAADIVIDSVSVVTNFKAKNLSKLGIICSLVRPKEHP
jgi:Fe-S cluster assembly protein SufB